MAVNWGSRSFTMTAPSDRIDQMVALASLRIVGETVAVGDVFSIGDRYGHEVFRHVCEDTILNVELLDGAQKFSGLQLLQAPLGAWRITGLLD
jgi:hypothetical protein